MNVLAFEIKTIPDSLSGRRLYGLDGLSDEEVAKVMLAKRVQKTGGSDFLPLHLHRIVAISGVLRVQEDVMVWSVGDQDSDEQDLITRFYNLWECYSPTLVSWNGGGFVLPVLHYRSLLNRVHARRYWDSGEADREMKSSTDLNRDLWRHVDLREALSGFNPGAATTLHEIAVMLGFPGKPGMGGASVWEAYQRGDLTGIRNDCETDALNTFLVYLRWEIVRGNLSGAEYESEVERVREFLEDSCCPHLLEFLKAWHR